MAGILTSLLGAAQPSSFGTLLGSNYDANAERAAKVSALLSNMGQALLYSGKPTHLGTIGTLGKAIGAGGQAAKEAGTSYLQEAMTRKLAADKIEEDNRAQAEKDRQDAGKADFIAANPQYRQFIEMYPKEFGEFWTKHMLGQEGILPGQKGTAFEERWGTTPVKRQNPETKEWGDYLVSNKGNYKKVDPGDTSVATGPGEATVRGKQAGEFMDQQKAAQTSVQNIDEAADNIAGLREVIAKSPLMTTGWGGVAFKDLPESQAGMVRDRIEQIEAGAFFANIAQMQGYGALSNAEGSRVAAAKSRIRQSRSAEDLMVAIDDYEKVMNEAFNRNQLMIQSGDYTEMLKLQQEYYKNSKFKKSRTPPFPGENVVPKADWDLLDAQGKRDFLDAEGIAY